MAIINYAFLCLFITNGDAYSFSECSSGRYYVRHITHYHCSRCPRNCLLNTCRDHTGSCSYGCKPGWYGIKCYSNKALPWLRSTLKTSTTTRDSATKASVVWPVPLFTSPLPKTTSGSQSPTTPVSMTVDSFSGISQVSSSTETSSQLSSIGSSAEISLHPSTMRLPLETSPESSSEKSSFEVSLAETSLQASDATAHMFFETTEKSSDKRQINMTPASLYAYTNNGEISGCGGILTRRFGTIRSPLYPAPYPPSKECSWVIEVDFGLTIELTIVYIHLEEEPDCKYDVLEIYNGKDTSAPRLAKLCHQQRRRKMRAQNSMLLRFKSDSSVNRRGFIATYTTYVSESTSSTARTMYTPTTIDTTHLHVTSNSQKGLMKNQHSELTISPETHSAFNKAYANVNGSDSEDNNGLIISLVLVSSILSLIVFILIVKFIRTRSRHRNTSVSTMRSDHAHAMQNKYCNIPMETSIYVNTALSACDQVNQNSDMKKTTELVAMVIKTSDVERLSDMKHQETQPDEDYEEMHVYEELPEKENYYGNCGSMKQSTMSTFTSFKPRK